MDLRYPAEIDAHLTYAALDAVRAVLTAGDLRIEGTLDMADSFGRVTFRTSNALPPREVVGAHVEYIFEGQRWAFTTWLISAENHRRWQLQRPRIVHALETQSIQAA
ncbi:MAG: hypothetical protein AAFV53_20950 [Myxococcota bacterium]